MTSILVIGASGQVGEHLIHLLSGEPQLVTTYRTHAVPGAEPLDISHPAQVHDLFERLHPSVVFLPAAMTNVDFCETNPGSSYRTNVNGVKNVVEASNHVRARLIYFSTDYIFDGVAGPYAEEDLANPISEYGRQKLIAEHHIASTSSDYLIFRTTVVYGWERQGKNFVYRLVKSLREGTPIRVPMDQVGTPTYAPELAEAGIQLSRTTARGVINVAGSNCISRYEFALEAARVFQLPEQLILPVTTKELNQLGRRPLVAGLKTEKAKTLLGRALLSSSEGLRQMSKEKGRPIL
jgi:dTDP-4-dehydrorhamnose reductase